jgi:uncharacterized protein YlxW (UPF0749 family)
VNLIGRFLGFGIPSWLVYMLAIGAVVGAIYGKGYLDAKRIAEVTALKVELDQERENNRKLKDYIARLEKAAKEDAEEKAKDDAEITDLKTKLTDLVDAISDPDRECFSADDIERLLGTWKGQGRSGHHPRR